MFCPFGLQGGIWSFSRKVITLIFGDLSLFLCWFWDWWRLSKKYPLIHICLSHSNAKKVLSSRILFPGPLIGQSRRLSISHLPKTGTKIRLTIYPASCCNNFISCLKDLFGNTLDSVPGVIINSKTWLTILTPTAQFNLCHWLINHTIIIVRIWGPTWQSRIYHSIISIVIWVPIRNP